MEQRQLGEDVDLSYSEAWRKNRWEAIYLTDIFPPNLAFDVRGWENTLWRDARL